MRMTNPNFAAEGGGGGEQETAVLHLEFTLTEAALESSPPAHLFSEEGKRWVAASGMPLECQTALAVIVQLLLQQVQLFPMIHRHHLVGLH